MALIQNRTKVCRFVWVELDAVNFVGTTKAICLQACPPRVALQQQPPQGEPPAGSLQWKFRQRQKSGKSEEKKKEGGNKKINGAPLDVFSRRLWAEDQKDFTRSPQTSAGVERWDDGSVGLEVCNLIFLTNKTIAEDKSAEARGGFVPFGFSSSVSIGVSFLLRSATSEAVPLQPL